MISQAHLDSVLDMFMYALAEYAIDFFVIFSICSVFFYLHFLHF